MCEGQGQVVSHDQGVSLWYELTWTRRACPYGRTWKKDEVQFPQSLGSCPKWHSCLNSFLSHNYFSPVMELGLRLFYKSPSSLTRDRNSKLQRSNVGTRMSSFKLYSEPQKS